MQISELNNKSLSRTTSKAKNFRTSSSNAKARSPRLSSEDEIEKIKYQL